MIKADPADQAEIEAFLQPHAPFAMFPLSNLADHGMQGGSDYAMTCWIKRETGAITDVMSLCDNGMAMPFLPSGDYAGALAAIGDRDITGMAGPRQQVRGLMVKGFAHARCTFDHDEPQFLLALDDLTIPEGPGDLRPLIDAPADIITAWIKDYDVNTLNAPEDQAAKQAIKTYNRYVAARSHMVLMEGDTPLAMTGFNARLPDIVQLGGIYTPPALRNQGHARRAVAFHLAQAAKEGVTRATLFSASDAAAKAYQAVGFRQIGEWSLILFDGPVQGITQMIRAKEDDIPAIEAFLRQHIATSMFPLVNLRDHGMAGGHARAVTCWLRWENGQITDVLTVTDEGVIFPQCPTGPWGDVAVILTGRNVKGVLGEARQVAALRQAVGLTEPSELDTIEPLFILRLTDMVMPEVSGFELHPLARVPRALAEGWRADYSMEALAVPGTDAAEQAAKDIAAYLDRDSRRVLLKDSEPVAMTGFNAVLPETVQIGGVYTPPASRSQGLARRAVAMHLAEARDKGVSNAILFAANEAAERAYRAIGFQHVGSYAIAIYADPRVIHG